MGQGAAIRDRFANVASMEVVESSAGTLTFSSLATNLGFLGRRDQALAMAIDEIQYSPSLAGIALMTAQADHIQMGITTRNTVADLEDLTDTNLIDFAAFARQDFGTAAGGAFFEVPLRKQFFPPPDHCRKNSFPGSKHRRPGHHHHGARPHPLPSGNPQQRGVGGDLRDLSPDRLMGDKMGVATRALAPTRPSRVDPTEKDRKKEPVEAVGPRRRRSTPTPPPQPAARAARPRRRPQTPAQRAASLRNLALARAARGT